MGRYDIILKKNLPKEETLMDEVLNNNAPSTNPVNTLNGITITFHNGVPPLFIPSSGVTHFNFSSNNGPLLNVVEINIGFTLPTEDGAALMRGLNQRI